MIPTPSIEALRHAAELCEFCPKMCRFACPVSEAAGREAWTPWAKSSLAALTAGLGRAPDPSAAQAFHACTGCLRCQHYCAHANDVPTILYAARAVAVRSGTSPAALRDLPKRYAERGHAQDADIAATLRELKSENAENRSAQAVLFSGCEALAQGGQLVRDALAAARGLHAPLELAPEGALCCGLRLLEGGHPSEFAAHALKTRDALGGGAAPLHLVFLQPGCARAVRDRWPGHGASLPAGSTVEHATTYLARALAKRPDLAARTRLAGPIAFHDPCELARGLGETEAPRALLAAAVEGGAREAVRCGADASCCGAAGLLPEALPAVARAIAEDRKAELGAPAATASPLCAKALGATDVISLVAQWLK